MEHLVVGTAGHVDHGKTVLIKALTGVDTDRLREEKERGISIDLGFAPLRLPSGRLAGVVDVPGHERFIHNMLAGAAGMDLVLLVVDANEGVMPQTREHLQILQLLGVKKGIVVITKIDLVEEEWRELVREEIAGELRGTFLESAPICEVSALTGRGIEELKGLIDRLTQEVPPRDSSGPLRLPVDRSFSVAGFGTVVTGTLLQGAVRTGDTVTVVPPGVEARVRNIQVHERDVAEARAGQRVALNLSGLEKEQVLRGSVVGTPGYYRQTVLADATLTLLPVAPRPLKNLDPVHFFLGTARTVARLLLLDREEIKPGEKALVQCRLERGLVAERGDPFIIRSYSPMTTIGGGRILDPFPPRHRRFRKNVLEHLKELEQEQAGGGDEAYLRQKLSEAVVAGLDALARATRLGEARLRHILDRMEEKGAVARLGDSYLLPSVLEEWIGKIRETLEQFHQKHPLAPGISRARLRGQLPPPLELRGYDALLALLREREVVETRGELVSLHGFLPRPGPADKNILDRLLEIYRKGRFQPPSLREAAAEAGADAGRQEELFAYLVNSGLLIKLNEELYLHREAYDEALALLKSHFAGEERLTLAQFRDRLGSSRKYVQALLEHFDREKITRRVGDYRVLRRRPDRE